MILTRSPYRVSFFGGGTDYEDWFSVNGGAFLSMSINYYTYISLRIKPEFQEKKFRVLWRLAEDVNSIEEIQHPIVRESLKKLNFNKGLDISYTGDLPGGSGMGSSSAFTAALVCALYADMKKSLNPYELSSISYDIEKNMLNETVGIQDQIATSFGGFNNVSINRDGTYQISPINLPEEELNNFVNRLVLVYTGITRRATSFAQEKVSNMSNKNSEFIQLQEMVSEAHKYLLQGKIDSFGKLLHKAWVVKRNLSKNVTNNSIDKLYDYGLKNGALGGKLLGAGGGGFLLFVAQDGKKEKLLNSLKNNVVVPFKLSRGGTKILYNEG